jgi:hypothetical protein
MAKAAVSTAALRAALAGARRDRDRAAERHGKGSPAWKAADKRVKEAQKQLPAWLR